MRSPRRARLIKRRYEAHKVTPVQRAARELLRTLQYEKIERGEIEPPADWDGTWKPWEPPAPEPTEASKHGWLWRAWHGIGDEW